MTGGKRDEERRTMAQHMNNFQEKVGFLWSVADLLRAALLESANDAAATLARGAGGSLRAGVTENPVRLTQSVKDSLTRVTCGGAPVYIWPGGGITFMADVTRVPEKAFGYVPTPALVAPIEFTLKLSDYATLGGHMDHVRPLESINADSARRHVTAKAENPWPLEQRRGSQE